MPLEMPEAGATSGNLWDTCSNPIDRSNDTDGRRSAWRSAGFDPAQNRKFWLRVFYEDAAYVRIQALIATRDRGNQRAPWKRENITVYVVRYASGHVVDEGKTLQPLLNPMRFGAPLVHEMRGMLAGAFHVTMAKHVPHILWRGLLPGRDVDDRGSGRLDVHLSALAPTDRRADSSCKIMKRINNKLKEGTVAVICVGMEALPSEARILPANLTLLTSQMISPADILAIVEFTADNLHTGMTITYLRDITGDRAVQCASNFEVDGKLNETCKTNTRHDN